MCYIKLSYNLHGVSGVAEHLKTMKFESDNLNCQNFDVIIGTKFGELFYLNCYKIFPIIHMQQTFRHDNQLRTHGIIRIDLGI